MFRNKTFTVISITIRYRFVSSKISYRHLIRNRFLFNEKIFSMKMSPTNHKQWESSAMCARTMEGKTELNEFKLLWYRKTDENIEVNASNHSLLGNKKNFCAFRYLSLTASTLQQTNEISFELSLVLSFVPSRNRSSESQPTLSIRWQQIPLGGPSFVWQFYFFSVNWINLNKP